MQYAILIPSYADIGKWPGLIILARSHAVFALLWLHGKTFDALIEHDLVLQWMVAAPLPLKDTHLLTHRHA